MLGVIILAAGKGTRMHSALPKVLHPIGGQPMLAHLLATATKLTTQPAEQPAAQPPIVVCGHERERIQSAFAHVDITWITQAQQLGTGHAVLQALPHIADETTYLILVGDAPLIQPQTLTALAKTSQDSGIAVLTVNLGNPTGYGRIICDTNGHVTRIVEEKEASATEKTIQEINSGCFAIRGDLLKTLLPLITNDNQQHEYYLTDVVALAAQHGYPVKSYRLADSQQIMGCNNKKQLATLERIYQRRQADSLLDNGVTLFDPNRFDMRGQLTHGQDVSIDINCLLIGNVHLADNVTIGANCIIKNSHIGAGTVILPNTIIEDATIGAAAQIGPFARIRPNTRLADATKIGNFVELKNTTVGIDSKINHLSYVGDAVIGDNVNIGAGAITCNYDGANKHLTTIEDNVFVGSNTALVAPIHIAHGATIGAGSTISKPVASENLAIARSKQRNIENWQRPQKQPPNK
nr:bifunctional UDP-N-acetylglucosamine diphosphorylase/glucosamine-1-phosphate N-acetyltransferase GlmU [Ostreibacterium oceani]